MDFAIRGSVGESGTGAENVMVREPCKRWAGIGARQKKERSFVGPVRGKE